MIFCVTWFWCICTQVNEIAFINTLEAQNKKIEVLTRHQVNNFSVFHYARESQQGWDSCYSSLKVFFSVWITQGHEARLQDIQVIMILLEMRLATNEVVGSMINNPK